MHEPRAPFDQSAGQQAIPGERGLGYVLNPVTVQSRRTLAGQVEQLRVLACMRKAVSYAAMRAAISPSPVSDKSLCVECMNRFDRAALSPPRDSRGTRQVQNRFARGAERHALVSGRKKSVAVIGAFERGGMPERSTTKPGKSRDSLPNPYPIHDPMLGRPN